MVDRRGDKGLAEELDDVLMRVRAAEADWSAWVAATAPACRTSARNLVQYRALRQQDLRGVQQRLSELGLSSLGRSESHVEARVLAVSAAVRAIDAGGSASSPAGPSASPVDGAVDGTRLLLHRAIDLLGPEPDGRYTRIMVTLPSEAATDPELVRRLVDRGMNVARINCAHDDAVAWRAMAAHVRDAARAAGRECRVAMDLAGPKLRTGPLELGPPVVRLRPVRDPLGRVQSPAVAWLTSLESPLPAPEPGMVSLPVPGRWLERRRDGEVVRVQDTRGAHRELRLSAAPGGWVATTSETTYLATGTALRPADSDDTCAVGTLPRVQQAVVVRAGDVLRLTRDCSPAPVTGAPPRIGCTLPAVFDHGRVGHHVFIDDGKIGGVIEEIGPDGLRLRITHSAPNGSKVRGGRGVNVPDTRLPISALTDKDLADLPTVLELADLVALSFVRSPEDVAALLSALDRLGGDRVGIVLKIETRQAFEQLPQLLLTAMRRPRVGVMIARGDLAVECGYARMAELQEEILWLCESAHLPVIWATQVLEQLAKRGQPSRAELTDAAMGERAECVMLNKGPHIADAVSMLDNVLHRMTGHHYKKNALMRPLRSWHDPVPAPAPVAGGPSRDVSPREARDMDQVRRRMRDAYAGRCGEDTVCETVERAYQEFTDARVRTYVPLLTEREARRRLRRHDTGARRGTQVRRDH
jgi:pyruvate kinase